MQLNSIREFCDIALIAANSDEPMRRINSVATDFTRYDRTITARADHNAKDTKPARKDDD